MNEFWSEVRIILKEKFNESEIKDIIFDTNINENDLESQTAGDLARELLSYIHRTYNEQAQRNFVQELKTRRPNAEWPAWPEDHRVAGSDSLEEREVKRNPPSEKNNLTSHSAVKTWHSKISPVMIGSIMLAIVLLILAINKLGNGQIETAESASSTANIEQAPNSLTPTPTEEPTSPPLESTTNPITITTTKSIATSEPIATDVPASTEPIATEVPASTYVPENKPAQIEVLNRTGLFVDPDPESARVRFVDGGEILIVLAKNKDREIDWLYVEKEGEYSGWIKIKHIKQTNKFSYASIPTISR